MAHIDSFHPDIVALARSCGVSRFEALGLLWAVWAFERDHGIAVYASCRNDEDASALLSEAIGFTGFQRRLTPANLIATLQALDLLDTSPDLYPRPKLDRIFAPCEAE